MDANERTKVRRFHNALANWLSHKNHDALVRWILETYSTGWSVADKGNAQGSVSELLDLLERKAKLNTVQHILDFAELIRNSVATNEDWDSLKDLSQLIQNWLVN